MDSARMNSECCISIGTLYSIRILCAEIIYKTVADFPGRARCSKGYRKKPLIIRTSGTFSFTPINLNSPLTTSKATD
jgi:hypothetical protein